MPFITKPWQEVFDGQIVMSVWRVGGGVPLRWTGCVSGKRCRILKCGAHELSRVFVHLAGGNYESFVVYQCHYL